MKQLFILAVLCVMASCSIPSEKTYFLALGDSYTIGESVTAQERWPEQLVVDLKTRGLSMDSLQIIAQTGWTTDELLLGVLESPVLPRYDLVTVMVGVNNQYRGRSLENFRNELSILLEKSIQYAGDNRQKVFVISIPDWGVTPFAGERDKVKIASEIDAFNAEIIKLCKSFQLRYIDVTEISRQAEMDSTLIAADGLHPSGQMYAKWVEKIAPIVLKHWMNSSYETAKQKDATDPLAHFYASFQHPKDTIYLDGNSLGKLPLGTAEAIQKVVSHQWGENLIASWNKHWLALPQTLAQQLAQLLKVDPKEIIIGESTSVRLFQITQALVNSQQFPNALLTDSLNFPTDLYILQQIARQTFNQKVKVINYDNECEADLDQLKESITKTPGIYCVSLVTYKSGFLYPMLALNQLAKKNDSIIIWDLSHAVGVVDLDFKTTETLVALGCTYKYLNGGPGAPAFLYVDKSLISKLENPVAGWFGHAKPFDFDMDYVSHPDIGKMAIGTPPILSLVSLQKALSICLEAETKALQQKSRAQTQWLLEQIEGRLTQYGIRLESPKAPEKRGAHISISHPEAWRITQALQAGSPKIIPDYRPEKYIRLGLAPLYTRYQDLQTTVDTLEDILKAKTYQNFQHQKAIVT